MTASPDRAPRAHDHALWPSQLVAQIAEQRPHSPWSPASSSFASSSFASSPLASSSLIPSPRAPSPRDQAPAFPSPTAAPPTAAPPTAAPPTAAPPTAVSQRPRASVAAGDPAAPSAPSFARFLAVVTPVAFLLTFAACSVVNLL